MPARLCRTRPPSCPRAALALAVVAVLIALVLDVVVVVPVLAGVVSVSAPVRPSTANADDVAYCRSVRHLSGILYYDLASSSTEVVPVGEVHTAPNVFVRLRPGGRLRVSLPGGLRTDDGRWAGSAASGATGVVTVTGAPPVVGGGQHRTIHAVWNYVTKRVICIEKDPRTGQIARRDATPRFRYVPVGWTARFTVGPAPAPGPAAVPRCFSGRPASGRLRVPAGESEAIGATPGAPYPAFMSLTAIGLTAGATTTPVPARSGTEPVTTRSVTGPVPVGPVLPGPVPVPGPVGPGPGALFMLWTSSGTGWVCGNATTLATSSRLYANAL